MTLASARVLRSDLDVEEHDAEADAQMLTHLLRACEVYTPLVAADGVNGILLDITGCVHLFGGEEAMLIRIRQRFRRLGFHLRLTLAGTPDAAHALARFSDVTHVPPGQDQAQASSLPVSALEMEAKTHLALERAGLKTLGDLAARPSRLLAARFGMALTTKLQRILGAENRRITPLREPPDCIAERHFADPMDDMEVLLHQLARLSGEVSTMLERRAQGGRCFEISFFRADGMLRRLIIETSAPMRDTQALMRLVRLRIDTLVDELDPGFGFDAIRLAVLRSEAFRQDQKRLDGGEDADLEIASLIDRLVTRFGKAQVQRFLAHDTHDPLRVSAIVPVASKPALHAFPMVEHGEPPLRPVTLFDPPQPVDVLAEVPDGPPMRFRWRRLSHDVARAEGPERIAPEWWRRDINGDAPMRDYYRVETADGHRFWLYREGLFGEIERPRWFLHGVFA
jgi:protein ImuB